MGRWHVVGHGSFEAGEDDALTVALLLAPSSCAVAAGSGRVVTETREVSSFSRIELATNGDVIVAAGPAESLTIEADDNIIPSLTSEVSGTTLKLDAKPITKIKTGNPITFRVTVKELRGLALSGSGSITGDSLALHDLDIVISGSGRVKLAGTADTQTIAVSGSGRYDGADLRTQRTMADVSRSGQIVVAVGQDLKINITGSGSVSYTGRPKIEQQVIGSGRVVEQ